MNTQNFSLSFSPAISFENDTPRNFTGTAYSGGVIPQYGWFGDVVIDLSTMKTPTKPVFALINHDTNQRAGKCELSQVGGKIEVLGTFSQSTSAGQQVAAEFAEGAPWEFSVGINAEFESFKKPKLVEVNGQSVTVNGVFRNASVREVSFVPAGADPNTKAVAFQQQELPINLELIMSDELNTKLELMNQLNADLQLKLSAMQDEHAQVVADLKTRLAAETTQTKEQFERANALMTELSQFKTAVRLEAIKSLFADMNKDFSETSAQPYQYMGDEQFAAIAADFRSMKPVVNPNSALFSEVAKKGKEGANEIDLAAQLFNQVAGVK